MTNFAALRKKKSLTQRQLADLVGVTESTIRQWESNRDGNKFFARADRLCEALGAKLEDLYDKEDLEKK